MKPRIIVMAAGEGERWGDNLGRPKHLTEMTGEPLLERTIRQFAKHSDDVWAVIPHGKTAYRQLRAWNYTIIPREMNGKALGTDKFASSIDLWHGQPWFILVYGDVQFTDEAVATICQPITNWKLYARPTASEITGHRSGECFAFSITLDAHDWFHDRLVWLTGQNALGQCPGAGGWHLYRAMTGRQLDDHSWDDGTLTVIDDLTDDIDYPADYDMLQRAWHKAGLLK